VQTDHVLSVGSVLLVVQGKLNVLTVHVNHHAARVVLTLVLVTMIVLRT
jgi:hypothetical protein